jgi:hypothetical protein
VADRERSLERTRSTDAADDRIDRPNRHAGLHEARNRAMDGDRVTVTAACDERPDDGVAGILHGRSDSLAPCQPTAPDELQLTHAVILATAHARLPQAMDRSTLSSQNGQP